MLRFVASIGRKIGARRAILVGVVVLCALLVAFNMFRTKMIGEFFAHLQKPAVTISASKIEPITWTPEIEAIGTLWAIHGVDVASEVAGVVESINFKSNEHVDADQLLVQIDDSIERADLLAANAAVDRDRAQLERARQLRSTGVSSVANLQDAESTLAASQSSLAKIQAVLDQKAIKAPFSGIIGIPRIDVGQYVQAGTVIATVQQLDTMRVDFTVPEQDVEALKIGQPASFGLSEDAFKYKGHIIGIDPKIDPQLRLVSVRAELENPDGDLRPGQFVRVRVELPTVPDVIAVPQTAVVTSLYGDYVYVVESASAPSENPSSNSTAAQGDAPLRQSLPAEGSASDSSDTLVVKQIFVKMGRRHDNLVEITSGLSAGATVVTSGQNKLTNNATVTINNAVDPATAETGAGNS